MKTLFYLLLISFVLFNTSCITKKPYAEKVSSPDYNQRITVEKPNYVKKENALGVSLSIGFAGVGGYLGYQSDFIKPNKEENLEMAQVGSSILGAVVGYSITRLITNIAGKNKVLPIKDKNKWLNKLNKDFTFIKDQNNYNWRIINNSIESTFKVKNLSDIEDFNMAFPDSKYTEELLSNSLYAIKRHEIPKILKLYPNTKNKTKFQLRFYYLSKNVSELKTAKSIYPESRGKFNICSGINTFISTSNKNDLDYLIKEYSNSSCISKIKTAYVGKCSDINECFNMSKKHPDLIEPLSLKAVSFANTLDDFDLLYKKFPNRKDLIGSKASLIASSIEDLKKVYNNFEGISIANKNDIEDKALSIASSIDELSEVYNEFVNTPPTFKNKVEIKALSLAFSIEDLGRVYNDFKGISIIAEQEALSLASTLEKRKEFLQYFPDSINSSHINKLIISEEKDIAQFKKIANDSGSETVSKLYDAYSNYALRGENYGMESYSYENGFVRISVFVKMNYYLSFGGNEGSDNKIVQLFNIFSSRTKSAVKREIEITYDILLYKNRKPKIDNYSESGVASMERADNAMASMINSVKKSLREMASYNFSTSYYENEKPCYAIIDKSTNFLSGTITYKVKCRDGDTEFISYYPNKGTYSNTLLSPLFTRHISFSDAIKDYCGCN